MKRRSFILGAVACAAPAAVAAAPGAAVTRSGWQPEPVNQELALNFIQMAFIDFTSSIGADFQMMRMETDDHDRKRARRLLLALDEKAETVALLIPLHTAWVCWLRDKTAAFAPVSVPDMWGMPGARERYREYLNEQGAMPW